MKHGTERGAQEGRGTKLFVDAPRPSRNRFVRAAANHLFGHFGPPAAEQLDQVLFAAIAFMKLRDNLGSCDKIFSYDFYFAGLCSLFGPTRKKTIYNENGGEWIEIAEGRASLLVRLRYGMLGKWVMNRVRVIAQSESNRQNMEKGGVRPEKIRVVRYGRVDPETFHPTGKKAAPPPFRFLFVGRLVPQKGLHVLISAFEELAEERPEIALAVVGPPAAMADTEGTPYSRGLREAVESGKLREKVRFLEFVSQAELIRLYSESHVSVLPSIQDAFPSTCIESMMCGTPMIGTSSGGMKEMIVDGVNGFLVPPNDRGALLSRLRSAVDDYQAIERMGASAREYALANFDFRGFSAELLEAIQQ